MATTHEKRGGNMSNKWIHSSKVDNIVVRKIIAELQQGTVPWHKKWFGVRYPVNALTKRPYSGANILLLEPGGEYLTWNQIQKLKGKVRKGAHSYKVIFWKLVERENTAEEEDGKDKPKQYFILRYYLVFDLNDVTGIETEITKTEQAIIQNTNLGDILNKAKTWVDIKYGNYPVPYFKPSEGIIRVPYLENFENDNEFCLTLLHEIMHSTGPILKRQMGKKRGDYYYAVEELTAEIGAAILAHRLGIETDIKNTAAYINHWLSAISKNNRMVLSAARQAERAVNFILEGSEAVCLTSA